MIVVESPLTYQLKLEPLFLKMGSFQIDIVPFVVSFLRIIQAKELRYPDQFDCFMEGMIDTLNEILEEGVKGRSMTSGEEMKLRMSVTLRIYQILCGGSPPAES